MSIGFFRFFEIFRRGSFLPRRKVRLYVKIAAEDLQGIGDAVHVATLVTVAGVDACADETVANVTAGTQGGLHVGAIEGIDVHGVIGTCFLGG